MTEAEHNGEKVAGIVHMPERLTRQSELTRHAWIYFHLCGRAFDEIAQLLGISCRRVNRLRKRAEYAARGWPCPSLVFLIRLALMRKRLSFEWHWKIIFSKNFDDVVLLTRSHRGASIT